MTGKQSVTGRSDDDVHGEMVNIEVAQNRRVDYIPEFLYPREADVLLGAVLSMDMAPEVIRMFGADIVTKRWTAQFGVDYSYNATAKRARRWTTVMASLRDRVAAVTGRLDSALVQVYPDGSTGIGWHRDKGHPEVIASLSLGAEREFAFGIATKAGCQEVWRMPLAHGSLLLIPADTNNALKHRLPTAARITTPRVNVTFRRFPVAERESPRCVR